MRPCDIVDDIKKEAHQKYGKEFKNEPVTDTGYPLVPITIFLSADNTAAGEVSEEILWRLGDPAWEPKAVAGRFCQDMGLPAEKEKEVEGQILYALQPFLKWKDLGGRRLVLMKIYARNGSEVLVDEVVWNLNDPLSTSYAYAAQMCESLKLSFPWFEAVNEYVQRRLDEYIQDLREDPAAVDLIEPEAGKPIELEEGVPRVEKYETENDYEAERKKRRNQRKGI
ncbi:hypothetical protein CEUSTIGMA_g975.t1 [Chlamydomonas eustigma]|uniref:Uncharacterized protein n=1 Tax=Chlamydomonas eustigma TaxID=1157962 RepID=A0A250WRT8_9CHLO|nr:hypothetical protein CEUSTIGMA_g975.t1 [Chlamydomonas eustigma]|eukprot:GAX73523.1 hypothetical protein CEUSTIGMA_g975.t1 [Chlamydomonas eustigma]